MDRLLSLIEERWKHLLGLIADEHDPLQLRAMIAELDGILRERKEGQERLHGTAPENAEPGETPK